MLTLFLRKLAPWINLALASTAWITLPEKHASYLMLWIGIVLLLALLFTIGLGKYSQRAQS
jgi:cytochrome oxidase assembly protein ShyY1